MNYFFLLVKEDLKSNLSIPKFKNSGEFSKNLKLFGARIEEQKWKFYKPECIESENFWKVESDDKNFNDIYFLASAEQFDLQTNSDNLLDLNNFTNTFPDYRANLSVKNKAGAISSYQSEYPHQMTQRTGSIYSSISTLGNFQAVENGVFVRNIYDKPFQDEFDGYIYDYKSGTVLKKVTLITNSCNFISFEDVEDNGSLILFCKGFLGVPIYFSKSKAGNLSLEHTHPPHENIQGPDRFKIVSMIKKDLDERVS
tara:strand:- start:209 stop:973 length:765 start_codon:yes stop_codon:yes gene_type:complete